MSHASVLVAVDAVDPTDRAEIEAAVRFQMEPYDEDGEWFQDGSRWDWYVIGGRFTGLLSDYDPGADPRNFETCTLCAGTGVRPNGLAEFGSAWFSGNNGCNGCSGKGTSLRFSFVPFDGDIVQVKNLDYSKFTLSPYAFLIDRHWHEPERMGWFGSPTATECERKESSDPEVLVRRCLTVAEEGARVVVWNEPFEVWSTNFRSRFIDSLHPDTVLVVVDYHV